MNWSNNQMRYAYFIGFMDAYNACKDKWLEPASFENFIDKANELIDHFGFKMNYDEFEELISLYDMLDTHTDEVDGINYIIVGDIDDEDSSAKIVFMNNHLVETISVEDFKKLKMNKKSE